MSLRTAAAHQQCTLRLEGCTVDGCCLCHYRRSEWAGTAMKPVDLVGAWGCGHCHDLVDRRLKLASGRYMTDAEIDAAFGRGMARTLTALAAQQEPQQIVRTARKKASKGRAATPSKIAAQKAAIAAMGR